MRSCVRRCELTLEAGLGEHTGGGQFHTEGSFFLADFPAFAPSLSSFHPLFFSTPFALTPFLSLEPAFLAFYVRFRDGKEYNFVLCLLEFLDLGDCPSDIEKTADCFVDDVCEVDRF